MNGSNGPINIYQEIVESIDCGRTFAVALVVETSDSTPQKAGVRAIIDEMGHISGTIGGGAVEAESQRRAIEVCRSGRPIVFDFNLDGPGGKTEGPICGGAMRIAISPANSGDRGAYAQVAEAIRHRRRGVIATTIAAAGEPKVTVRWFGGDVAPSNVGFPGIDAIRSCLADERAGLFIEDSGEPGRRLEVLVQPVIPQPLLLIVGGGHIGQALAHQAILVGFDIVLLDDRSEFTDPALFPEGAASQCGNMPQSIGQFDIGRDTYIVIVTRGHTHDAEVLEACIHTEAAYVGMIGSTRKVGLLRDGFIESGIATEAEFDRVFAPIGVHIGSVTVPEIAASIVAELIAVRRKGGDWTLQKREGRR